MPDEGVFFTFGMRVVYLTTPFGMREGYLTTASA